MTEERTLLQTAELGMEAETFIATDIGKELVRRARGFARRAQEQLATINPCDAEGIRTLQNEIWLGKRFEQWLAEMIKCGWEAEELIKQGEEYSL